MGETLPGIISTNLVASIEKMCLKMELIGRRAYWADWKIKGMENMACKEGLYPSNLSNWQTENRYICPLKMLKMSIHQGCYTER